VDQACRTVLFVEDNPGDARLILEMFRDAGDSSLRLEHVDSLAAAVRCLAASDVDVILLDLSLPDSFGLETFGRVQAAATAIPIVVLTGLDDATVGLSAVQQGAQDYLIKGQVEGALLVRALGYAIERARLFRQVEEAVRLRDSVLSSVSHDLRGPLTPIRLIAETLRLQLGEPGELDVEDVREGLSRIEANVARMAKQIDELLDVAQLQVGGQLRLARGMTELVALARDVVADYQQRTTRHEIQLETSVAELVGTWDSARLERVLGNLLSNAIKYSPVRGVIVVEIATETDNTDRWAVIHVRDQGAGIPAAEQSKVFSWFYRGRNVAHHSTGAGIGLAGSSQIVALHGGTLTVQSEEGAGSTFTVRLPIDAAELVTAMEPVVADD
jgi:signal transduction histidine kinase